MYPRGSPETSFEFDVPAISSTDIPEFVGLVFRPDLMEFYDPKALVSPEVWRR
jgi:hypothetical protein